MPSTLGPYTPGSCSEEAGPSHGVQEAGPSHVVQRGLVASAEPERREPSGETSRPQFRRPHWKLNQSSNPDRRSACDPRLGPPHVDCNQRAA